MGKSMARPMTEQELLTAITEAATLYGWRWHHIRRSDKAVQQGHAGFPDLVLAREGKVLFLELKAAKGVVSDDQWQWVHHLGGRSGVAHVIWPDQLNEVLTWLK